MSARPPCGKIRIRCNLSRKRRCPKIASVLPSNGWCGRVMVTCSGRSLWWVVCRGVLRPNRSLLDDQVRGAPNRGSENRPLDPEMAEGGRHGARTVVRGRGRDSARGGDHAPYTKGNFQFERIIRGWRTRYPVLDLRLKK